MLTKLQAILCMTILIVASPILLADGSAPSRATLKGIDSVGVVVEVLPEGAKTLGLTEEMIRNDVELKLRLAGLGVVSKREITNLPGGTYLYVNVTVTKGTLASSIDLELVQDVRLERNGQSIPATTWSVGRVAANENAQEIRDDIKDHVDNFLNAWLSVNPKK